MNIEIVKKNHFEAWSEIDPENWRKIAIELIELYQETSREYVKSLEKAWSSRDVQEVGRIAHKLKSACGNVGATQLQRIAIKIEELSISKPQADLSLMVQELLECNQRTATELAGIVNSLSEL